MRNLEESGDELKCCIEEMSDFLCKVNYGKIHHTEDDIATIWDIIQTKIQALAKENAELKSDRYRFEAYAEVNLKTAVSQASQIAELKAKISELEERKEKDRQYVTQANKKIIDSQFDISQLREENTHLQDTIECIVKFDKTETLEVKGKYFEVIQRDLESEIKDLKK